MNRIRNHSLGWSAALAALLALATAGAARAEVRVLSAQGEVALLEAAGARTVRAGETLAPGARLRAGADAVLHLRDDAGALLIVRGGGEVELAGASLSGLTLHQGGVDVMPAARQAATVSAGRHTLRGDGYFRLYRCARDCGEPAGLYGMRLSGALRQGADENAGVLQAPLFHLDEAGGEASALSAAPAFFNDAAPLARAREARKALDARVRQGIRAFKDGDYAQSRELLQQASQQAPLTPVVSYYLGLVQLELKDKGAALRNLQDFVRNDPQAAREKKVPEMVTLLASEMLQAEVKDAMAREAALSEQPPEPGTIAVHAFTNRKDPAYAALAKGIAAMVISDLSKVPGVRVLERQKLQKLLDELKLSASGLVDQAALVRSGRLMSAEKVVVGSFGVEP